MNRAFHTGAIAWVCAAFLSVSFGADPRAAAAVGAFMLLAAIAVRKRLPLWLCAATVAFGLSLVWLALHSSLTFSAAARFEGVSVDLRGLVIERVEYGDYARLTLIAEDGPLPSGIRVSVGAPGALDVSPGDVVEWELITDRPDAASRAKLYADAIGLEASVAGAPRLVGKRPNDWRVLFARYRDAAASHITRYLTGPEGGVLAAMATGRSELIAADLRADYARSGLSHLLAVSGLHLTVFAGLFDALLSIVRCGRRTRAAAGIAAVLLFMLMAGCTLSVVRAAVMAVICRAALLLGRDSDTLNSLGFALTVILLQNPYAIFSTGLQLSYLATMGIAACADPVCAWCARWIWRMDAHSLRRLHPFGYAALLAFSTSVCAGLFTAPVLCLAFGQLSLVAPVANVLAAPFVTPALAGGLLCGLLGFIPPLDVVARACALAGGASIRVINTIASWWGALPFASVPVRAGLVTLWMGACILGGALLAANRAPYAVRIYAASLAVVALLSGMLAHAIAWGPTMELAVSQSGTSVALACGGQGAVIGEPESVSDAQNLAAFLKDSGVKRISLYAVREEGALFSNRTHALSKILPVDTAFGLDRTHGFAAELPGARISAEGKDAESISIEMGGLRIVKTFDQIPAAADVLINARGQIVAAPGVMLKTTARYYNCEILTLRRTGAAALDVIPHAAARLTEGTP